MHTERFRQLRKEALSGLLNKKAVSTIWRKIVKDQLRSIEIKDLFDHYDFNYNIEERAQALKVELLEGSYQVSTPLIYRLEKKYGVCRHMVIPQPVDALLLQVLVESVAKDIIDKQPSKNAFYSRDKHNVKKPHEEIEYGVSFRKQWKKLQKKIYKFNSQKELLTVTDLTNYFDSISLDELRKVFVSLVKTNEVLVDLLFKVIEGISWTPDYLPYSKRGLPTANIEAIRLLAHSFLFEIDEVIKNSTGNSFARWMDDITIGNDSHKEAITLLSSVSDMLKSRGLALNLSKTTILDTKSAHYHFQIDQNHYLDSIDKITFESKNADKTEKEVAKRFRLHLKDRAPKYWDKVAKRYITAFGRLKSKKLLKLAPELYLESPGLRPNILIYLSNIRYGKKSSSVVLAILRNIDIFDDLSLYQICFLLTSWDIPRTKNGQEFVKNCDNEISRLGFQHKEPLGFYSILWFRSKYQPPNDLAEFILKYRNYWNGHSFLRRQVTASLSRLLPLNTEKVNGLLSDQKLSGIPSTVSVANQLSLFSELGSLEKKVRMYLFPTHSPKVYPHAKFLVLCSVLNSEAIRNDPSIKKSVEEYITDRTYRYWLKECYGLCN
ncbi:MAG: RNA-directed DNA polymerase [Candidatus Thiodiazotropha taylori]